MCVCARACGGAAGGQEKVEDLRNKSPKEIQVRLDNLLNTTGRKITKKPEITSSTPSFQGVWTPSTTFTDFKLKV